MTGIPKVSVLVPIYNVEKYLHQCVDSILAQTLRDIEIILINDGSTDTSLVICQEYAANDPRVKIIDKPNEGYGKTMNRGLDAATGEYISIVESDDWIEPDMLDALYTLAKQNNCDIVKSNYYDYINEISTHKTVLPDFLANHVFCARDNENNESVIFYSQPNIWSAIYRRDFLRNRNIRFLGSPGASYQDTGFNFKVWAMADRAYLTKRAFLHYRQHPNQSVASTGKVFCVAEEWAEVERFMNDYPEWKKASTQLRHVVKMGSFMWNLNRLTGADKKKFHQFFVNEYKNAFKNNELYYKCFANARNYINFRQLMAPNNILWPLSKLGVNFGRLFLKSRFRNDRKHWYILAGLIPVYSKPAPKKSVVSFMGVNK